MIEQKIKDAANAAISTLAEEILEQAQTNVPVVTGELKDSAEITQGDLEAVIAYRVGYAARVHENPNSAGYKWFESVILNTDVAGRFEELFLEEFNS